MDLPSSGWYPDPYGTPSLLRWWDGSVWTPHTHPDVSAGGAGAAGGEQAAGVQATGVQPAAVQATAVQAAVAPSAAGGQAAGQPAGLQATAVQSAVSPWGPDPRGPGQPSSEWLRRTKPPTGRPTQPQPALPDTAEPVAPTASQAAVTTAHPAAAQPSAYQPAAFQPTHVQPGYPQPATTGAGGGDGTQVMAFGGSPWQTPAGPGTGGYPGGPGTGGYPGGPGFPGGPGNPGPGSHYGYLEAQRRRRRNRLIGGISAGTAVAVAVIAVIVVNLGGKPAATTADPTKISPAAASIAAPSPTLTASPSPSASAAPTAAGSTLTDAQSGVLYTQLPTPWQGASCPSSLDIGAFTWTAGEYAAAGQVNGGSMTWYGEACSGPLPQQYGYASTAQLQGTAETLAQTFENAYYNALGHTVAGEQDQPVQVSGHPGWEVSYDVSYNNPAQGVTWTDEQAAVVVVDNGAGNEPAVFFTSVPQNLNEANVTTLVSSLQLISVAGTPAATGTASPVATAPGDGAGANP